MAKAQDALGCQKSQSTMLSESKTPSERISRNLTNAPQFGEPSVHVTASTFELGPSVSVDDMTGIDETGHGEPMSRRQQKILKKNQSSLLCCLRRRPQHKLQVFDNLFRMPGLVNETLEQIKGLCPDVANSARDVSGLVNLLKGKLNIVSEKAPLMVTLIKFIQLVLNVRMAATENKVGVLLLNLFTSFGVEIYNLVSNYVSRLHVFQSTSDKLYQILAAIGVLVFQGYLGWAKVSDFKTLMTCFTNTARGIKSQLDLFNSIPNLVTSIKEFFDSEYKTLDELLPEFEKWALEVRDLNDVTRPLAIRIETDPQLVYTIDRLYRQSIDFSSALGKMQIPKECSLLYSKLAKIVDDARKLCDYTGVFGNRPRQEPIVIQIFGESGVGKSGMAWPLAVDLNAACCSNAEEASQFARNIYFRNAEQEFWDGYAGQNVVCYDDFGQSVDSSARPNPEFMELIRAANLAPYPLHMAELGEKKRTKFSSRVIILSSNVENPNVSSLTYPDAFRRRIGICAKITNKEEYVKECYSKTRNETVKRLDHSRCDGPLDTRVYLCQLYNAENQMPLLSSDGEPIILEYEEFVDRCLEKYRENELRSRAVNTVLSKRIDEERFQRIKARLQLAEDDDEQFHDCETNEITLDYLTFIMKSLYTFRDFVRNNLVELGTIFGTVVGSLLLWRLFSPKEEDKIHILFEQVFDDDGRNSTSHDAHIHSEQDLHSRFEAASSGEARTPRVIHRVEASSGDPITRRVQTRMEASSGDPVTRLNTHRVEAATSGDPLTRAARHVTEASSGDPVTRTRVCKMEGQEQQRLSRRQRSRLTAPTCTQQNCAYEGNVPAKPQPPLSENCTGLLEMWKDHTAQDLISTRIVSNLYKISIDGVPRLNGLFIRDRIMLAPRHLELVMQGKTIEIENLFGSRFEIPLDAIEVVHLEDSQGGEKDGMLIRFPSVVNAHSDLVKHFQTMPELSYRRFDIALPTIRNLANKRSLVVLGNADCSVGVVHLSTEDHGEILIRDGLNYNLNTRDGDCGSPVIAQDSSILRKICGIHVAASLDGRSAFAQSITQADLNRGLAHWKPIVTDYDRVAKLQFCAPLEYDKEYTEEELRGFYGLAARTFAPVGESELNIIGAFKTDIRKSSVHGFKPPTTQPAILFDREVNIMDKNLMKAGENIPYIPKDEIQSAVNDFKAVLFKNTRERLRRVLTFEEAVAGIPGEPFVVGLTRNTSPGYPWTELKDPRMKGKSSWFGNDAYIFDSAVQEHLEAQKRILRSGERLCSVFTDTLKDERRSNEKVAAKKTRVFAAGPMDLVLLIRMYFLGFVANAMENRILNEISLGTNPFGADWDMTARMLRRKGKKVFAGDFSNFDGTLNSGILHEFVGVVNEWYDDGEENARIREALMLDVINAIHIKGSRLYAWTHGQPSGNPLTTILNSFYNSVSMRIAYRRCARKAGIVPPPFQEAVGMVSYGDDNVINMRDDVSSWFNQQTVAEAYKSFGMTYTDEGKSGVIPKWKTLEECAYLKRGFVFSDGKWKAPLDLDVILEMCNWVRKSPSNEQATLDNVETACRELALHPSTVFDHWTRILSKECWKKTHEYPTIMSQKDYIESMTIGFL